ncbi:MAG: GHKL domain-containing protein [Ruminococcus sp.]|nr:GHKL domain-containing protein [Ruminococcus sp.]
MKLFNIIGNKDILKNKRVFGQENYDKNHISLTHRIPAKVAAFILVVIMVNVTLLCGIGITVMIQQDMYSTPKENTIHNTYDSIACNDISEILHYVKNDYWGLAEHYCSNKNINSVYITDSESKKLIWKYTSKTMQENPVKLEFLYMGDFEDYYVDVNMTIFSEPVIHDDYMLANNVINFLYSMLYWIYVIAVLAFICGAVSFVFLMCASGHKKGYSEVKAGWGTKIPFDLLIIIFAIFLYNVIKFFFFGNFYLTKTIHIILFVTIITTIITTAFLGWLMSFVVRIKLGEWWKNTIIYRILRLLWRGVKWGFSLLSNIPIVWKSALIVAGISFAELILMVFSWNDYGSMIKLWLSTTIILGIAVLYSAFVLKKLQKGGEALANGDLSHHIDTSKLHGNFKKHGESLNNIAAGMSIAVEERLKSERFKTELITNVSHDIKTPLTSIINYTDLITKEPCYNEKITEYSQVLLRQSERLKRLIDDLVEASKASTGNIEILFAPCEANILLTQAVGEYEDKLQSKNLELITNQPENPIMIMADGRRLWRVFDNLINNICKYAQSSTRVYLSLETQGDEAVITFKNTSHAPLNVSAEELMERFVRGDSSRHTEGSGLGLSIAKSLTELQNGILKISIDGDLFKVTLRFPVIK